MQLGTWIDKFLADGGVITLCKPKEFKPKRVKCKKYLLPNCRPVKFRKVCVWKKRRGLTCEIVSKHVKN
jgi:hypothetical protein